MKAILPLLVLVVAGCASRLGQIDGAQWSGMQVGMSRAEVIQLLGTPRSVSAERNIELLEYVQDAGVLITKQTGIWKRYQVQLTDGRVTAYGAAKAPQPQPPTDRRPEVVQDKYAEWSTMKLQLRREQLARAIPDTIVKVGVFANDFSRERQEKEEIEMELLRRFEAGDAAAELKPLPRDDVPKARAGTF